jgi:hypothetical protein
MSRLEVAGCEFNRNGKWYSGANAKFHLLRKLRPSQSGCGCKQLLYFET